MIAGLILAAGESRRATSFKLLLPYDDTTVVGAVGRAARTAGLEPLIAVVGHRRDDVAAELETAGIACVENPEYRHGIAGSVRVGIAALSARPEIDAVAVLLGDEPGIRPAAIRAVTEAWRRTGAPVVRARYADRPGHPVLLDRSVLHATEGAADFGFLRASSEPDVTFVELDRPAPIDVDTDAAYLDALARLRQ